MSYIVKLADGVAICDTWEDVTALPGQIVDIEIDERDSEDLTIVTNLMSGMPVVQSTDTPLCCDPSSEPYQVDVSNEIRARFWDPYVYRYIRYHNPTELQDYVNSAKKAIKRRLSEIQNEKVVLEALLKDI